MRTQIVAGCSSAGFGIVGLAMPVVFPDVDPLVGRWMLGLAGFLFLIAFTTWLTGLKGKPTNDTTRPLTVSQDHRGTGHNIVAETVNLGPPAPEIKIVAPMQVAERHDGTFQRYFTFEIVSESPLKTLLVAITGSEILDISFNPLDQGTVNYGEFPRKGDTHLFRLSGPSGRYQVVVNTTGDKSPVEPEFGINQ